MVAAGSGARLSLVEAGGDLPDRALEFSRHQRHMELLPSEDPLLVFLRRAAGQTLLFAFNFDSRTVEIPGFGVFIGVCEPDAAPSDR
jgi:hypothetical protein